MFAKFILRGVALAGLALLTVAFHPPDHSHVPDLDKRRAASAPAEPAAAKARAAGEAELNIRRHPITGSAAHVRARQGFLSGPEGQGKSIGAQALNAVPKGAEHRATKAFLLQHRALLGHGPEALDAAVVQRDFVTRHNGLRTVTWQQQVDGIPVFEGVFTSHTTARGELVSVVSQFVSDAARANLAGRNAAAPALTSAEAVRLAANSLNVTLAAAELSPRRQPSGAARKQEFAPHRLVGDVTTELVWLPMDKSSLRLCWNVVLKVRARGEMFRVLIDALTGEVLVRRGLTVYASNATFRVFTSDSPSPFSPGHPTPLTNQPARLSRSLETFSAVSTNASPDGWVPAASNQTVGNNVDAHRDTNDDDAPDLPRPQGSPFHVFDPALDLTQSPGLFGDASVVQLFYWCNWMHDKLYDLGFTEAAGNFQLSNFGRGGAGNDPVLADAQDGGGFNNANMSTLPDGVSPRMQMYLFNGPNPDIDGSFDAEIVLHEYTHGLSTRLVGGGIGINELQTVGMGEGWSDFYALALLSEPGDNLHGNYALGGYATHLFSGLQENYYYGIRRYPYSTDLTKNPLTFKDIDPTQASSHSGVPTSPVFGGGSASEVHNQGEVWCAALWEARANLITKHGWTNGNQLILQLVTDGMKLSPPNPNFLEARDAILEADLINSGGANYVELWAGFAKRGMGAGATSPASDTTVGVVEAFDLPDALSVTPGGGFTSSGPVGGPFPITNRVYTLQNTGSNVLNWAATTNASWLSASLAGGTLATGASVTVTLALTPQAYLLSTGIYVASVQFTNLTSGLGMARTVTLRVGQPDFFTETFENQFDLGNSAFTFTPDGSPGFYRVCRESVTNFFTNPTGGEELGLVDDSFATRTVTGTNVSLYGRSTNVLHIGSNGFITFDEGDTDYTESASDHFALPRVTGWFRDLNPVQGGDIFWQQLSNRVVATWDRVTEYGAGNSNSFQIEMFFDGRIRVTYLHMDSLDGLVGLSQGLGLPSGFDPSDFSSYAVCNDGLLMASISAMNENAGTVTNGGLVSLPFPVATNVNVALVSAQPAMLGVPASVLIPAGSTNGFFDLAPVNDALLNGTRQVQVQASAPGFAPAARAVTLHDNESATLGVVLTNALNEGAGDVGAVVTSSVAPDVSVTVYLASSDSTELTVPPFVMLPAGQTSAVVTFNVVEEMDIDGPQSVTVTANVTNWTAGAAAVTIEDNEIAQIDVFVSVDGGDGGDFYENLGTVTGAVEVYLSGNTTTNLVVSLLSSDVGVATVPATVLIPAGQSYGVADLTLVDDVILDGPQAASITASAPGFVSGVGPFVVQDDEIPFPPYSPSPAHLATNVPANTGLAWRSVDSTNDVYLGLSSALGPAQYLGTTTGTNWSLPLLAPDTTYYWRVVARRLGTNAGPVWKFTTRGLHHFAFSSVSGTQYAGLPFPLVLTAQDEFNTTVSNFNGTAALTAAGGSGELFRADFESGTSGITLDNNLGLGHGLWHVTSALGFAPGHSPTNSLYYGQNEGTNGNGSYNNGFGNEGVATLPSLNLGSRPPPHTLRFHHLVQTENSTNWDRTTVEISTNAGASWQIIAARHLATNSWTNDFGGLWRTQSVSLAAFASAQATLRFHFDSVDGVANNFLGWYVDDVVVSGGPPPVALTPTNAGFVNGVWSNLVTFTEAADGAFLKVSSGAVVSTLGPLTVLNPPRLTVTRAGVDVVLRWPTVPGRSYQVEAKGNLDAVWTNAGPVAVASGAILSVTNTLPPWQQFFRVRVE